MLPGNKTISGDGATVGRQKVGEGAEQPREDFFLGMVAHELRNPLTPLRVHLQLLQRRLKDSLETPGVARAIEAIERNLDRLEDRIEQIQSAAHVRSGTFAVAAAPCDLSALAHAVVDEQSTTDLGLIHRLQLTAPAALSGVWDSDRLHQALTNLVTNALKYSPPETAIQVNVERVGVEAVVTVADQGAGIRPADRVDLFQPYSDLYRRTRVKGLGLGLFLVRGIVEAHGGRVWVESDTPDQGCRFGFALPLTPSETATRTSSPAADFPAT